MYFRRIDYYRNFIGILTAALIDISRRILPFIRGIQRCLGFSSSLGRRCQFQELVLSRIAQGGFSYRSVALNAIITSVLLGSQSRGLPFRLSNEQNHSLCLSLFLSPSLLLFLLIEYIVGVYIVGNICTLGVTQRRNIDVRVLPRH